MKLKKLEINGFKSFVDKACIEFPAGISAIVGPNGCGKSNVVDAIRWVMGEQSVKQLRGKAMEDVIFAGTNGKPPLNMAEVSLTLLNDNGSAPEELKDFTEIMLTRRLYRSGESAYYINKQLCRLKDIHNVFMGSGLGPKSYAVIQQGNIGAITDAGPEERRYFIEEAAGVTRFISRKNEALRKVDSTNQNLLRVSDIITEVKRQMGSLKRQAKKAELYKKFQDRIKRLDVVLAHHAANVLTEQIAATDALLKNLKDKDIEHITQLKKLDAAIEGIKQQRWQKNQEISEQKSQKFETQRSIDRRENDLAYLNKDIERLAQESAELEIVRRELFEKNQSILSEIDQVKIQNSDLKSQIQSVKATLNQEMLSTQSLREELSGLNGRLEDSKAELMERISREAQYKNFFQNAQNNKENLKRRLKRIDEEEALAAEKASTLQEKETQAAEELKAVKAIIVDLNRRLEETRAQLESKSKALGQQVKTVQTLDLERNKLRSRFSTLKKMEENFEWYKEGVRAIMKNARETVDVSGTPDPATVPRIKGIIGLLADIIEPETSFEPSVEAALGEALQYILVENQEAGTGAIDFLQTQSNGRSGFIPLASIKPLEYGLLKKPDASRRLLNHVSVKPGFEPIAEALLGHVVVTDTISEALDVFNRNGALQSVVTKGGDMITPQGIMIGGNKENLSGILTKKQELKELEQHILHLDKELESARQEQKQLEGSVLALETTLHNFTEQKNTAVQNEITAEKSLYKVSEELKHARRHLEIVRLEQEQLMGEESDIEEEMAKYNYALAEIESEVAGAQKTVAGLNEAIGSVSTQLEAFDQRIVDLKLQLTALNAKLENSNNTLTRLQEFQTEGIKRLEQLGQEINQKNQKRTALKEKIAEFEQTLSGMYADLKRLDSSLELSEADYLAIDNTLKEKDTTISTVQNEREEVLQKMRLLEIEQSQRQMQRDNISNRLEERYHQPFGELKTEFASLLESPESQTETALQEKEDELTRLKSKISKIIDVNLGAIKEYEQLKERCDFLCTQRDDLEKAVEDLHKVIRKINKITKERFLETFDRVNEKLTEVFPRLFEGGTAKLVLTDPEKPLETGVEYMIHPPGKKLTRMSLLSGGEKALAAIAFIFSIFLLKPTSFCLMDEIDAPLDEANIFRFNELLKIIGTQSQIVMITHNKRTMEFADTLFGITMEKKGVSKVVSVNFERQGALN
ncbi:MAG: chromosome segregation protein SMC [Thermodesulfobacteriota bacterium]